MEDVSPKERILQAAVHLFARKGFAGTGLRELAAMAEVNLAMINYFFGSKKDLLKVILDGFFEKYLAIARRELTGNDSLHTKIVRFIKSAVSYFAEEQNALMVTITELPHDDPDIVEHKAGWAKQMAEIIDREICKPLTEETGRDIPPTCIGPILTSLMASRFLFSPIMNRVNPEADKRVTVSLYTEIITNIFLQGIRDQSWDLSPKESILYDHKQ